MAVDRKERGRKLSAAEVRRLERFEALVPALQAEGYRMTELTVGIVKANVYTLVASVPVCAISILLFVLANQGRAVTGDLQRSFPVLIVAVLVLTVVHELVHGFAWSRFAKGGLKDIEFGFMVEYLTPYCVCTCPLERVSYIVGALAPLVTLGLVPLAISIAVGSWLLFVIALIMTLAAGGDVIIVWLLLSHGSAAAEQLVVDHPTQAGCVVFER